jgi:MoxR-like ATPase
VLAGVALCAVLVGPVAVAQASDNTLRSTLNAYGPKIVKDEKAVKNGVDVQYPNGHWKKLTRALKHEVRDLRALKRKLAHESASSARGRKAKRLIVKGLNLIANAYAALRNDVLAVHGGPVPKAQVNAAIGTDKKGRKKLLAGLHLLS